ncbi:MAG: hypothetical protein EZS28_004219 [Streblomastix strix]|uniref:Uncharacterized protein n=1 Tax=Streblomastix strix TaxID=222440 RepID=A0A5J4X0C6_9EUKA|nr:MAG: hypothetical protein EZS28_004219 [Streblomastix strix]
MVKNSCGTVFGIAVMAFSLFPFICAFLTYDSNPSEWDRAKVTTNVTQFSCSSAYLLFAVTFTLGAIMISLSILCYEISTNRSKN